MPTKSQPSVLYISPKQIHLLVPSGKSLEAYQINKKKDESISRVFATIQKQLSLKSLQIVLSPQLIEVVNLLETDKKDPDQILLQTADQVSFDITSKSIAFSLQDEFIHVIAISSKYLRALTKAATKHKLFITGIFAASDVLSLTTADDSKKSPYLTAWKGLKGTRGIVQLTYRGLSFSPKTFARLTSKKITDLMKLCIDNFDTRPKQLLHNLSPKGLPDLPKTIKPGKTDLDPLEHLTQQPQDKNHPLIPSIAPSSKDTSSNLPASKKPFNFIIFAVIAVLLVIAGLFVGGLLISKKPLPFTTSTRQSASGGPTASPTPTLTPTPTPLDLQQFELKVLNGTGTPGQAGQVEKILTEAGFQDIQVGNADSYQYRLTQVQLNPQAPEALYQKIKESLNDSFPTTISAQLESDAQFDAVVITGQ